MAQNLAAATESAVTVWSREMMVLVTPGPQSNPSTWVIWVPEAMCSGAPGPSSGAVTAPKAMVLHRARFSAMAVGRARNFMLRNFIDLSPLCY